MKWLLDNPMLSFDSETTGTDVETDRIVTAAAIQLRPPAELGALWAQQVNQWLINPGVDIPEAATAVHGITSVFAKEHGSDPLDAIDAITGWLLYNLHAGFPIVGCNLAFDLTMLDRECRRHQLPTLEQRLGRPVAPILDALVLDKHIDPYRKGKRTLTALAEHYGVRMEGAHSSTGDALAAARVIYRIGKLTTEDPLDLHDLYDQPDWAHKYGARHAPHEIAQRLAALRDLPLEALHRAQIGWRQEQCDSLRAHLDRKGEPHDGVPGDWPVIPARPARAGVS